MSSRCKTACSPWGLGSECLGHGSMSVDDVDCRWRAGSSVLSGSQNRFACFSAGQLWQSIETLKPKRVRVG